MHSLDVGVLNEEIASPIVAIVGVVVVVVADAAASVKVELGVVVCCDSDCGKTSVLCAVIFNGVGLLLLLLLLLAFDVVRVGAATLFDEIA